MTYKEIAQMINSIGLPYTYYSFPIGNVPDLPYVVFYYPSNDDLAADNTNYQKIVRLNIELYTKNKDFATEELVESVLNAHDLVFSRSEDYLTSENMYEVLYEMEVLIKGESNGQ